MRSRSPHLAAVELDEGRVAEVVAAEERRTRTARPVERRHVERVDVGVPAHEVEADRRAALRQHDRLDLLDQHEVAAVDQEAGDRGRRRGGLLRWRRRPGRRGGDERPRRESSGETVQTESPRRRLESRPNRARTRHGNRCTRRARIGGPAAACGEYHRALVLRTRSHG
jgi:hypothetical protein